MIIISCYEINLFGFWYGVLVARLPWLPNRWLRLAECVDLLLNRQLMRCHLRISQSNKCSTIDWSSLSVLETPLANTLNAWSVNRIALRFDDYAGMKWISHFAFDRWMKCRSWQFVGGCFSFVYGTFLDMLHDVAPNLVGTISVWQKRPSSEIIKSMRTMGYDSDWYSLGPTQESTPSIRGLCANQKQSHHFFFSSSVPLFRSIIHK